MIHEKKHAGEEHFDTEEVSIFDKKMAWDPSTEVDMLLELGLPEDDTVIDFGSGTGVFPLAVAEYCDRVVAVGVSDMILDVIDKKLEKRGIHHIETVHDGFLSYDHQGDAASFVFSKDALHHLPDFWKVKALKSVGKTLEPGGVFRLRDFVFSFDPQDSHEEIHRHFREEYSTYGFLLESMLQKSGFEILESEFDGLLRRVRYGTLSERSSPSAVARCCGQPSTALQEKPS